MDLARVHHLNQYLIKACFKFGSKLWNWSFSGESRVYQTLTNRTQEIKERILFTNDRIEEMDTTVKEHIKNKNKKQNTKLLPQKHPGNLRDFEKTNL